MNDDVFNAYCDKRCISRGSRSIFRHTIKKSWDYQLFELSVAIDELKQALFNALPKWLKKIIKGLSHR